MGHWVTYVEAERLLGWGRSSLNRAVSSGKLPVRRSERSGVGQVALVDVSALDPWERPPVGWVRSAEAAQQLGVERDTVSEWCIRGLLQAVKVRNRWFIAPDAVRRGPLRSRVLAPGVTVADAASVLNLPVMTLRRAVAEGEVPSQPSRHGRRVEVVQVETWMESKARRRRD